MSSQSPAVACSNPVETTTREQAKVTRNASGLSPPTAGTANDGDQQHPESTSSTPTPLSTEYLQSLIAAGLLPFALKPRAKSPLSQGWQTRSQAEDLAEIAANPGCNIGVKLQDRMMCFDFDTKNGIDGRAALETSDAVRFCGPLPKTVTVLTPTGGEHAYYLSHFSIPNSVKRLAPNVDTRGLHGLVVVPPSIHPNGGEYRFKPGHSPDDVAIAELPANWEQYILDKLRAPEKPKTPPRDLHGFTEGDNAFNRYRAERYLEESGTLVCGQGECQRKMYAMACKVIAICSNENDARQVYEAWAESGTHDTKDTGRAFENALRAAELGSEAEQARRPDTIKDGWAGMDQAPTTTATELAKIGGNDSVTYPAPTASTPTATAAPKPEETREQRRKRLAAECVIPEEFASTAPPEVDFVWGGRIPVDESKVTLLYSWPGGMKSAFGFGLGMARALGVSFQGQKTKPGRTLFVSKEVSPKWCHRAMATWKLAYPDWDLKKVRQSLFFRSMPPLEKLVEGDHFKQKLATEYLEDLAAVAKELGTDFVIFETAARLVVEETNEGHSRLIDALEEFARLASVTVLLIAHISKADASDWIPPKTGPRGGSSLFGAARAAAVMFRMPPMKDPMKPKGRTKPQAGLRLGVDINDELAERLVCWRLDKLNDADDRQPLLIFERISTKYFAALRVWDLAAYKKKALDDLANASAEAQAEEERAALQKLDDAVRRVLAANPEGLSRNELLSALRDDEGQKVTNKNWPDVVSGLIARRVVVEGEPHKPVGGGRRFKPLMLPKPSANDKG